ncbi:MAG: WD40 repeat domain-containing serine/threonine protein kinase [Verrucomicrobiia bacterium]
MPNVRSAAMNSEGHCPSCGRKLPHDSRAAVCPACEFEGALLASPQTPFDAVDGTSSSTRLGDYELLEEIAEGGMGVVYRARQVNLNRIVAIKMLLPGGHVGSHFVQRFRTEAEAVAKLQHPNIVAIHEVGEHEGRHFFSMEYVDGPDLLKLVGNKPLPARQAAGYVKTVAEAIHYAHQQGVLHRDLKPSNVLVNSSDQLKITDFGLAKVLTSDTELTLSGQVLGTPHYLPPEQASGKRGQIGPWSDVYGLGALLYFLLTSRPPFQAQELTDVLDQVLHREPVSPRLLSPSVPRDLETICLKCLEKEPHRRYASAQDAAEDLGRYLRSETIIARPVSPPYKAWRWCRRKPALAGALMACLLALVLGVSGISWQWRRAESEARAARRSLYDADMQLAHQAFDENNYGRVEQLLQKHDPRSAGRADDLRGWEWRYLKDQIKSGELYTLGSHSNTVTYLTFSPDGKWLASASHYEFANDVKIWDLHQQSCAATLPFERAQRINIMAFSPDSQTLAVADIGRLQFYQAPDWREPLPGMTISHRFSAIAYSADGRLLVALERDRPYSVIVMDAGDHHTVTSWPAISGRTLVLSPDGRYAAVQSAPQPGIVVYEFGTGAEVARLSGPGSSYRQGNIAFSPDGRIFGSVVARGTSSLGRWAEFWSVPDFLPVQKLQPKDTHFTGVTFSLDSQQAYLASADQTIAVYDVSNWSRRATLRGHRDEVWCVTVSPDGKQLASGSRDGTVRIWSTAVRPDASPAWPLPPATREVYMAPDGQFLATISTNHHLQLWRTLDFQCLGEGPVPYTHRYPMSNNMWTQVALAPGGACLAVANGRDSGGGDVGEKLTTFQVPSLEGAVEFRGLRSWPAGVAFSPDGKQLAAGSFFGADHALVWDAQSGKVLHTLTNIPGRSGYLKFSPRGTWLAIRLDESWTWGLTVGLWRPPGAAPERILGKPRHRIMDLTFSPDERYLATAGEDASVCIWDVATGERLCDLTGQHTSFTGVAWSPDGHRLVGGGDDGTLTIWDTASHQQVGRLKGHQAPVHRVAFLPDGNHLVSISLDSLRLWHAPPLTENRRSPQ